MTLPARPWSAAWLWELLSPGQPIAQFPDIDVAWDEVTQALAKAGIGVADTPLFLVFGEFPSGFETLFRSLPNGLSIAGASAPGSPIRAFANRDGIYLAVPGASLLGISTSVDALTMLLLGGIQTVAGPLVGAGVLHFLRDLIMPLTSLWRLLLGLSIIAMVLIFPRGLVGTVQYWQEERA